MLVEECKNLYFISCYSKYSLSKVEILRSNEIMKDAQLQNLKHAITTALLLLPSSFTEEELFKTITSISYTGSFFLFYKN